LKRIRACVATLTSRADSASELQDLSVAELHDISTVAPSSEAASGLFDHYSTLASTDLSGNLILFSIITFCL